MHYTVLRLLNYGGDKFLPYFLLCAALNVSLSLQDLQQDVCQSKFKALKSLKLIVQPSSIKANKNNSGPFVGDGIASIPLLSGRG